MGKLLTVQEAAERPGLKPATVRKMLWRDELQRIYPTGGERCESPRWRWSGSSLVALSDEGRIWCLPLEEARTRTRNPRVCSPKSVAREST